jgi:hypothetical protein
MTAASIALNTAVTTVSAIATGSTVNKDVATDSSEIDAAKSNGAVTTTTASSTSTEQQPRKPSKTNTVSTTTGTAAKSKRGSLTATPASKAAAEVPAAHVVVSKEQLKVNTIVAG